MTETPLQRSLRLDAEYYDKMKPPQEKPMYIRPHVPSFVSRLDPITAWPLVALLVIRTPSNKILVTRTSTDGLRVEYDEVPWIQIRPQDSARDAVTILLGEITGIKQLSGVEGVTRLVTGMLGQATGIKQLSGLEGVTRPDTGSHHHEGLGCQGRNIWLIDWPDENPLDAKRVFDHMRLAPIEALLDMRAACSTALNGVLDELTTEPTELTTEPTEPTEPPAPTPTKPERLIDTTPNNCLARWMKVLTALIVMWSLLMLIILTSAGAILLLRELFTPDKQAPVHAPVEKPASSP